MKINYVVGDGIVVSYEDIRKAVDEGRAVVHFSHGEWENVGRLFVYRNRREAQKMAELDTRGKCYSAWDEVWSRIVTDLDEALLYAEPL